MFRVASTIALLAAVTIAPGKGLASEIYKYYASHGPGHCQSALPVFDGNIRKRPKALANEGSSAAFVTCDLNGQATSHAWVFLINRGPSSVEVSCTLVDGIGDDVFNPSEVKTVTIASNESGEIGWAADGNYDAPAISCKLPPQTEISQLWQFARDEIGQ